jgi:hypothetical protein
VSATQTQESEDAYSCHWQADGACRFTGDAPPRCGAVEPATRYDDERRDPRRQGVVVRPRGPMKLVLASAPFQFGAIGATPLAINLADTRNLNSATNPLAQDVRRCICNQHTGRHAGFRRYLSSKPVKIGELSSLQAARVDVKGKTNAGAIL